MGISLLSRIAYGSRYILREIKIKGGFACSPEGSKERTPQRTAPAPYSRGVLRSTSPKVGATGGKRGSQ